MSRIEVLPPTVDNGDSGDDDGKDETFKLREKFKQFQRKLSKSDDVDNRTN
jgi:hypothetical protein